MDAERKLRCFLFAVGDLSFLVVVSGTATRTMHHAHALIGSFALAMAAGMVAAMIVQMVLAFLAAPLLGSIESMVPSMVIAMISPMAVCTLHLFGIRLNGAECGLIGAGFGMAMFVFTKGYGSACVRSLYRRYPTI